MGAIQLNNGRGLSDYKKVVKMIEADALYLHINPLQEAIQPGGDTNYKGLLKKIEKLVQEIDVPVFVKEVGHGLDEKTAASLYAIGLAGVDVAGLGGTSYAWIEAQRANSDYFARWFKNLGVPTDEAIVGAAKHKKNALLIASGGMRTPVAAVKARALGADLYSFARPILKRAVIGLDETIQAIDMAREGLQITLFSCGVSNWHYAKNIKLLPGRNVEMLYNDGPTYDEAMSQK
jgi:isopentenyl-diphosphate delta-isomerase